MIADPTKQSIYEIPKCTVCLEELKNNIVALSCGHCFHHFCADKHLERKHFCPNCRKISNKKDMRSIFYDLTQIKHLEKEEEVDIFQVREEKRKMKILIDSYELGTKMCLQKLNLEHQENTQMKERVKMMGKVLERAQGQFHRHEFKFNFMMRNFKEKEDILIHENKVLKTLLKFKKCQRSQAIYDRDVEVFKKEMEREETQESLNTTSDPKFQQEYELRRCSSVSQIY